MLEVLLARDLLHPVGPTEQGVERDERQRHELGEAAGALLELAHDTHVLGQLPRLLDVAEHHGHGRADSLGVRGLDDLDPARHRQLVGRDPLADAVVQHLRRGSRRRPQPSLAEALEHVPGRQPGHVAHVGDLHRRVRVQMDVRRRSLGDPQPLLVVRQAPVGMDARLHADLGGAELDRLVHAADELLLGVLVGVRRSSGLPEPAERAADRADVRDVDVPVNDERDRVPRELVPELVGRASHVLDDRRPGLGEQRGQLLRRQRKPVAGPRHRPWRRVVGHLERDSPARPPPWDERPVRRLDHVHHRPRDPLRIDVLGVHAQPLGQRHPVGLQPLADLGRRREWVLGRDVIAVGAQPAEVGGARPDKLGHQSDRFGGTWMPTPGISRRVSAIRRSMSSSVTSHAHAGASRCGPSHTPVRQYSRAAASAICAGSRP